MPARTAEIAVEEEVVADSGEAEAEILARRLDDAYEELADVLLQLDAARADAGAARAEAESVEDLVATARDLVTALSLVRQVEQCPAAFTWDERRERVARLHEVFSRAQTCLAVDAARDAGVVYAAVEDVAHFIETDGEVRRALGFLPRADGLAPWVAAKVRGRFKR